MCASEANISCFLRFW